jgi:hypothetical protein
VLAQATGTTDGDQPVKGHALVAAQPEPEEPLQPGVVVFSPAVARLPVELDVAVPVRDFRVRNLLPLSRGN